METELKFEVDPATADRLMHELQIADAGESVILKSVYYDTEDACLHRQGLALRVRDDGHRRVQTIKQIGPSAVTRGEWEQEIEGPGLDLDAAKGSPLDTVLGRKAWAALRPAFEVTVERAKRTLEVDGGQVEVALDRGAVSADGYGAPICELELELKAGSPSILFELAHDLSANAPLELSFATKADRGYALMEGAVLSPVKAGRPAIGEDDDTEAAFRAVAAAALAQITANARILRAARRPEAVHQLRVGLRRLRTAITLFGEMLEDPEQPALKAELKWITGELNDARNLDVFVAETFRPFAAAHPEVMGLTALATALLAAQTRAYDRAEAALRSRRFSGLVLRLAAWSETGQWTRDNDEPRTALRRRPAKETADTVIAKHCRRVLKDGRKLADLDTEARHHLRIAAKKLRYAGDAFAALYTGKAGARRDRFAKTLGDLQDGLGELNDIVVGCGLVAKLVGAEEANGESRPGDATAAFAAGQVCAWRACDADAAMKASLKALRRLDDAGPYWD